MRYLSTERCATQWSLSGILSMVTTCATPVGQFVLFSVVFTIFPPPQPPRQCLEWNLTVIFLLLTMEEPGELCIVVFAFIVTKPANECVCGGGGGVGVAAPSSRFHYNLCKDDSASFSRFLHALN
jgi:hypothetical protein